VSVLAHLLLHMLFFHHLHFLKAVKVRVPINVPSDVLFSPYVLESCCVICSSRVQY